VGGVATVSGGSWSPSSLFVGFLGNGTLNVTGSGAVTVGGGTGSMTLSRFVGATATLNVGTGGVAGTLAAGAITSFRAGSTLNFNHTNDTTLAASLIGTLAVTKAGAGTATLSGTNNTYAGTTTVTGGLLQIDANSRLGSSTLGLAGGGIRFGAAFDDLRSTTLTGSGGRFDTNGFTVSYASAISGTGALAKTGLGTLTLAGNKGYSGGTTVTQGTLAAGAAGAFGSGGITVGPTGTLDLGGYAVTNSITNGGGSIVNAAAYGGSQAVTGVVSMTGTVGGVVSVASGGDLKGTQTVFAGAVSVATGGRHSPGASPGTQTFTAGLSYDAGSILTWELIANTTAGAGTTYDFLSVTGGSLAIAAGATINLDFSSTGSTVDWSDPFWATGHSWTVIDVTGAATSSGNFTLGTVGTDSLGQSLSAVRPDASFALTRSGNDIVLVVVPEPSAAGLAFAGLAWAGLAAWRRHSSPATSW
jgi:autotransporter-associated beta strand protein